MKHLTIAELEAGLEGIRQSPKDAGVLRMIVRRPRIGAREVVETGMLDVDEGLIGDTWRQRRSSRRRDGGPHPDMQINIMNARTIALIAQNGDRWALAGDQLYIDLDLSDENLPPGTRLALGGSVVEITAEPHTGCGKFASRFGVDAVNFVNSPIGLQLHLRGVNARVVQTGEIRVGDAVTKI
jgi:MOSC domain-containing protein YiiM